MLYPLTFQPIFKERVWGGHRLQELYGKRLPPGVPIGESWEISDRPGDVSVIANGPFAGKDLHWLVEHHSKELLGSAKLQQGRFPLLIKILDAKEKLSLQVHPPPEKAKALGGEPKTEMWYIADAVQGAELFVGVKDGITREEFEQRIGTGTIADCFHRVVVKPGDAMFLPSGRVHAIGAGLVIFEIQQNSDTTYRVFDWNRPGLDGKPRPLQIRESLASINFKDYEPPLVNTQLVRAGQVNVRSLVRDSLFSVELCEAGAGTTLSLLPNMIQILAVIAGQLDVHDNGVAISLAAGEFSLIPASLEQAILRTKSAATFLRVDLGEA